MASQLEREDRKEREKAREKKGGERKRRYTLEGKKANRLAWLTLMASVSNRFMSVGRSSRSIQGAPVKLINPNDTVI